MLLDLMIHDYDYARWIGGEIQSVYTRPIRQEKLTAGVDQALVVLTHTNGIISHVDGSWAYPPPHFQTRFEIAGTQGDIRHDSSQTAPVLTLRDPPAPGGARRSPFERLPDRADVDPYASQLLAFYNHLVDERPIPVTAADGLAALKIGLAALESARTGLPVAP